MSVMNYVPPRPIRIEGDVAYVPLTHGYEAIIDATDAPLVGTKNWYAKPYRRVMYACRHERRDGKETTVRLHRFILGAADEFSVDHIDSNGLNNRRCNLRLATHSENARNQRVRSDNTSGFKGVYWYARSQNWRAEIVVNGMREYLGYFATPEAAHAAYCEAALRLHGAFARVG